MLFLNGAQDWQRCWADWRPNLFPLGIHHTLASQKHVDNVYWHFHVNICHLLFFNTTRLQTTSSFHLHPIPPVIYCAPCMCMEEHQAGQGVHKLPRSQNPSCSRAGRKLETKIPEFSPHTPLCSSQSNLVKFYWNRRLIITGGQVKDELVLCCLMLRAQLSLP